MAVASALPKPPSAVTAFAVSLFVYVPGAWPAGASASTETVQDVAAAPPARLPPDSEKLLAPGTAVTVPPVQVVAGFAGLATVKPSPPIVTRLSVSAMPASAGAPAARVSVTVSRDSVPACTFAGENALDAASTRVTVSTLVIVAALLPADVWTPFTAIVFVRFPVVALAATFTGLMVIVQLPFAGIVPPPNMIVDAGSAEVIDDPQVPPTVAPAGTEKPVPIVPRLSVTPSGELIVAAAPDELLSVIVSVVVPPCSTVDGENALLPVIDPGAVTVSVPDAAA